MEREESLMLSGFDKSITKGWKVKPLLIPPVVSKHLTVCHMYIYIYNIYTLNKQLNMHFNSSDF